METNFSSSNPKKDASKGDSGTKSITNTGNKWTQPKPFADEPVKIRIAMVLKWILASDKHDNILSGEEKLTNITVRLGKMKFNGYLRLFEIDMNIIKDYMTDSSWTLYKDFEKKHKKDAWKCPQCSLIFEKSASKWKCHRCLFYFHNKCSKPMQTKLNENSGEGIPLCNSCFFAL